MEELDPCCKNCLSSPILTSKDGTHRQCVRVCAEVTIKECESIRNRAMSKIPMGTNSVYPKPKSMVGSELATPMKYKYWVYAICSWTNDSGYSVSLDYAFTFETDHKFNSHSISECSNKIRVNVSADQGLNAVQESEMKIVIRFFGLLDE